MTLPKWLTKIPHPTYGNCCGASLECQESGNPVDAQDCACVQHDMNLFFADQQDEPLRTEMRNEAHRIFGSDLREDLNPYYHKLWGPTFNRLARLIFR